MYWLVGNSSFGRASAGCNNDGLRRSRHKRGAVIGEGPDAGQIILQRAGQGRTSQDKGGEGEDEAEGPHLTVSGLPVGSIGRLVGALITIRGFRRSASKRIMVSSGRRI